jgi:hypothetical protein
MAFSLAIMVVSARPAGHDLLSPVRSSLALDRVNSRLLLCVPKPGSPCLALCHVVPQGGVPGALCGLTADAERRFTWRSPAMFCRRLQLQEGMEVCGVHGGITRLTVD